MLCMVKNLVDELDQTLVDYICDTFGEGSFMDTYLMDYVIKYWKQDPDMSLVYRAGERVLLSLLFITVNVSAIFYFFASVYFFVLNF